MELHHKLRRDPSWHPSGCNICGQLGHQAAQCTTGTVNWRAMYGDSAFTMAPTVFPSDIEAGKRATGQLIDFADLERRAKDYAQMREETGGPPPQQAPPQGERRRQQAAILAQAQQQQPGGAPAPAPADPEEAERRRAAEDGLPPGWGVAFDAQKRPYFWHKTTKKTTWEKPTAATPIV